jgi:ABC-type hemin transport system ATPase subunit
MKVSSITLQSFSVFEHATLKFCPGVNVLIGTNATGKSHLMKVMYSMMKASEQAVWNSDNVALKYQIKLPEKLAKVFRPQAGSLGRLVKRGVGRRSGGVNRSFGTNVGSLRFTATTVGKLSAQRRGQSVTKAEPSLFIPSREVLSFHSSLIAAIKRSEIIVDETYVDLANALDAATLLGPRGAKAHLLVQDIEKVLGGTVYQAPDGSLHLKNKHGDFEPHLLSEGWRKLASLCRLILNGSLMANGFLFWDEPEANLNPEMIVMVAKMLRILANKGVQVFITTHDFLLTRHLALAADYQDQIPAGERCPIQFFGFSRTNGSVEVSQSDSLQALPENRILQEFAALYDREGALFEKSLKED